MRKVKKWFSVFMVSLILLQGVTFSSDVAAASAEPFLGEIRLFAGNFAPRGWARCDGQLLPISANSALFSILGTIYGGDGRTTFALPDLNGRAVMGNGQGAGLTNRPIGSKVGNVTETLSLQQLPAHNHGIFTPTVTISGVKLFANTETGEVQLPSTSPYNFGVTSNGGQTYSTATSTLGMAPNMITKVGSINETIEVANSGGNQAHYNMSPYLTLTYIICVQGTYGSSGTGVIGEIVMCAGTDYYIESHMTDYVQADGQYLSISQYSALFSLYGTTYGGDGVTIYALPDFRGRIPIHKGAGPGLETYNIGDIGGSDRVSITENQLPVHNHNYDANLTAPISVHMAVADSQGTTPLTVDQYFAKGNRFEKLFNEIVSTTLTDSIKLESNITGNIQTAITSSAGGGLSHNNMMPTTAINILVCVEGSYPSPNGVVSDNYLGMISMNGFDFAEAGQVQCDGQILPINLNTALFSILGTTYGGDGRTSFAIPDLRGRTPLGDGSEYSLGSKGGMETVPLNANEIPAHSHIFDLIFDYQISGTLFATNDLADTYSSIDNIMARGLLNERLYSDASSQIVNDAMNAQIEFTLSDNQLTDSGNGEAHENRQPYQVINFVINTQGVFPSRN